MVLKLFWWSLLSKVMQKTQFINFCIIVSADKWQKRTAQKEAPSQHIIFCVTFERAIQQNVHKKHVVVHSKTQCAARWRYQTTVRFG
jgi:hypothetical protein